MQQARSTVELALVGFIRPELLFIATDVGRWQLLRLW